MSLCKGGCLKSCNSAIVKCTIHGEGDDKGGDEGVGGGGGGGVSGGEDFVQEKNHYNQL